MAESAKDELGSLAPAPRGSLVIAPAPPPAPTEPPPEVEAELREFIRGAAPAPLSLNPYQHALNLETDHAALQKRMAAVGALVQVALARLAAGRHDAVEALIEATAVLEGRLVP